MRQLNGLIKQRQAEKQIDQRAPHLYIYVIPKYIVERDTSIRKEK